MSSSKDLKVEGKSKNPPPSSATTSPVATTTNSRLSSEDPRSTTLNYEYQEQPTVKLNLSPSELQFLENDDKSQLTSSSQTSISSGTEKPDRNGNRFFASVSILISLGLLGVGINALYSKSNFFLSLIVIFFSLLVYEWNRLHGITLSRKLRPIFNLASVFATYKHRDPDTACLYAADKDKYDKWACCNVPEINSELPRTSDEHSPTHSPPNAKNAARADTPGPKDEQLNESNASYSTQSEQLETIQSPKGAEVKLTLPPESFK